MSVFKSAKRKAPNVSANSPELRIYAELGGIDPTRLAAALRDPKHLDRHITIEEWTRAMAAFPRYTKRPPTARRLEFHKQIAAALEIAVDCYEKQKAQGLTTNA